MRLSQRYACSTWRKRGADFEVCCVIKMVAKLLSELAIAGRPLRAVSHVSGRNSLKKMMDFDAILSYLFIARGVV